ncbi:MAG: UDP-N-acetylglucosamine 2-epimerase (non-hydrolyzing) [bacterium]
MTGISLIKPRGIGAGSVKLLFAFGTRAETIKIAPVIREIQDNYKDFFRLKIVSSCPPKEINQVFPYFNFAIRPQIHHLQPGRPEENLIEKTPALCSGILDFFRKAQPDMVVVQGSSPISFMAAIAAFYSGIPVAHIEAGLRTYNKNNPFLDEFHRHTMDLMADILFAPNSAAQKTLLHEKIPASNIFKTGNTVVDALNLMLKTHKLSPSSFNLHPEKRLLLVTLRRPPAFTESLKRILGALTALALKHADLHIIFPIHLEPWVYRDIYPQIKAIKNIQLIPPQDYPVFIWLMQRSHLILTDSGGIQEEAATLGKPVLILRESTERPELIRTKIAKLVPPFGAPKIIEAVEEVLGLSLKKYRQMIRRAKVNPYGDGKASQRIVQTLYNYFNLRGPRHAVKRGKDWLLNSGIQELDRRSKFYGAINAWFDVDQEKYGPIYPESTGYGITTFLFLNRLKRSAELIERARSAANWIISQPPGIKAKYYRDPNVTHPPLDDCVYAFDNGIILNGLVNLYETTNEKKYLEFAKKTADFLWDLVRTKDKKTHIFPYLDPATKKLISSPHNWATQFGPHQAKIAIGLLNLYKINSNSHLEKLAIILCKEALKYQAKEGRFITKISDGSTNLHPHCYAAEGLLYVGLHLRSKGENLKLAEKFIQAAAKAVEWVLDQQKADGSLRCVYGDMRKEGLFERSDALAQVLRLGLLLISEKRLDPKKYSGALDLLAGRLGRKYQYSQKGPKMEGAIYYGTDFKGIKTKDANSWCTMFALQALIMYRKFKQGEKLDMELFI